MPYTYKIMMKLGHDVLENFILRQILENFSDLGIKVREPWDTNSKLAHPSLRVWFLALQSSQHLQIRQYLLLVAPFYFFNNGPIVVQLSQDT